MAILPSQTPDDLIETGVEGLMCDPAGSTIVLMTTGKKVAAGENLTLDEYKEIILKLGCDVQGEKFSKQEVDSLKEIDVITFSTALQGAASLLLEKRMAGPNTAAALKSRKKSN